MTLALLDTDAIIDYLKGVASTIAFIQGLNQQGHQLCVCAVVECEVYTGLPPQNRGEAAQHMDAMEFLPTPRRTARSAGDWRGAYRSQGIQLSTTDCLIAAVAVEHDAILVTANLRHFPMPELTLQPLPRAQGGTMR